MKAVVPLASRGQDGMTGSRWGVAYWARGGAEGEGGSDECWRLMVEASEGVKMWVGGDGSTIIGVWSSGHVKRSIMTVWWDTRIEVLLDMLIEGCFVREDGYFATGVNACVTCSVLVTCALNTAPTVSQQQKKNLPGTRIAAMHGVCIWLQARHWTEVRLVHIRVRGIGRCQERAGGLGCVVHNGAAEKGDQ